MKMPNIFEYGVVERASWIALKDKLAHNSPFALDSGQLSKNYNNCDVSLDHEPLRCSELDHVYGSSEGEIHEDRESTENESITEAMHDYCIEL
jgi:hypothetical protein